MRRQGESEWNQDHGPGKSTESFRPPSDSTVWCLAVADSIKARPHKIAKNWPLPLVRKMSALAQPSPCWHTINFKKCEFFLLQKVRTSASEKRRISSPPCLQNVQTGQIPFPTDCWRLLWTAPKNLSRRCLETSMLKRVVFSSVYQIQQCTFALRSVDSDY